MSDTDPEQEGTILKLLHSGVTYEVIRQTVHCSKSTISAVKQKHGTELGIPAGTGSKPRKPSSPATGKGRGTVKLPPTPAVDDPKQYASIPAGDVKALLWAKMKACPPEKLPSLVQEWQNVPDTDVDGDSLEGDDDPFKGVPDYGEKDLGTCNTRWIVKGIFDDLNEIQEALYNFIDAVEDEGHLVMPEFENEEHLKFFVDGCEEPKDMADGYVCLLDRWAKAGVPMKTIAPLTELWPDIDDPRPQTTYAARAKAWREWKVKELGKQQSPEVDVRARYEKWMQHIFKFRAAHALASETLDNAGQQEAGHGSGEQSPV